MSEISTLANNLSELKGKVEAEAYEILIKNAELIAGLAQIRVRVKTGALRDSIRVEVVQANSDTQKVAVVAGSPTVNYAGIVEAKYPYLAPSFQEVQPQLADELKHKIQGVIDGNVNK